MSNLCSTFPSTETLPEMDFKCCYHDNDTDILQRETPRINVGSVFFIRVALLFAADC